jgi:hypothetical protein
MVVNFFFSLPWFGNSLSFLKFRTQAKENNKQNQWLRGGKKEAIIDTFLQ